MAESQSGGDKTETATGKRRTDARKQGQVCQSRDLTQAVVLLVGVILLYFWLPLMMDRLRMVLITVFDNCAKVDLSQENIAGYTAWFVMMLAWILLPFMLVVCGVAFVVVFAQVGPLVKEMKFDLSRMNPITALGRLFSPMTLVKTILDLGKLLIILPVVKSAYDRFFPQAMGLMDTDVQGVVMFLGQAAYWIAVRIFFYMFIIAIVDYVYQRWKYEEDLKMTKVEVKEEMKSQEGDPEIKQKIRNVQMMMARRRMLSAVPKADVVITNPIHYAVAVQYDMEKMAAPTVVAKGARKVAERIKEIARENNVPIVENRMLARGLFKDVEIGGAVPEKLYKAVADVLAFVYKLNKSKMSQVSQHFAAKTN